MIFSAVFLDYARDCNWGQSQRLTGTQYENHLLKKDHFREIVKMVKKAVYFTEDFLM